MNNRIIFIGALNIDGRADDGETMKNQILVNAFFKNGCDKICIIDTRNRPKRLIYLLRYVLLILFYRKSKLVFSASSLVTYKLMKIANILKINPNNIYYWVIGGKFADYIELKKIDKKYYLNLKYIFVEGNSMKEKLNLHGFTNVKTIPNFKCVTYVPQRHANSNDVIRFVFLSRIIPQKGVDLIVEASKKLNALYGSKYIVDFYGKIDSLYETTFLEKIKNLKNINYKGFLDLTSNVGYDKLATYNVMLFPTFWEGEGFPGVVIDAFIAGLPIIASDWNLNSQIIKNGKTGYIIPVNNIDSLVVAMQNCIERTDEIQFLSQNTRLEVDNYNVDKIIDEKFLKSIELL